MCKGNVLVLYHMPDLPLHRDTEERDKVHD